MTPLGWPVEPEVYMMTAMESVLGGEMETDEALPLAMTSSKPMTVRLPPSGTGAASSSSVL